MSVREEIQPFPTQLLLLEETDSTNAYLKRHPELPHGTVVIAKRQSGGRGRLGRQFASPEGGLYLSLLLKPRIPLDQLMHLTAMAAVAVRRAIRDHCGILPEIKWLNDLLWQGRKLCGILAESFFCGGECCLILGIGINCNTPRDAFPEELRDSACSLAQILGKQTDPEDLTCCVLRHLSEMERALVRERASWLGEYTAACVTIGKKIRVLDPKGVYEAEALGIDEAGALQIRTWEGDLRTVSTGEVSIRGIQGYH